MTLDPRPGPITRVADDLRAQITSGKISAGAELDLKAISGEHHVDVGIVRLALARLARKELVERDLVIWRVRAGEDPEPTGSAAPDDCQDG